MIRDIALARPAALPRLPRLGVILRWTALARQRRQLAELDAAALEDMGISRIDAEREARRPFWDAPAHWTHD